MKSTQEIGVSRIYNTAFGERGLSDVIKWEAIAVSDGEKLYLHFESVDSPWRQGVWLRTDSGISVNERRGASITLWQDTAPKIVPFTCHTKNGFLSFYNVWFSGRPHVSAEQESLSHSSGMLAEEIPDGRRYRCNDIGFTTNFQKLVFSIKRKPECA